MTKIETVLMIVTHLIGLVNLFVIVVYLAKKMHASVIEKYVSSVKTGLVAELNGSLTAVEKRFQAIETYLSKPTSLVASPSAASSPSAPVSQDVVSPPAV